MKWVLVVLAGAVLTAFAWRIAGILSADAIGMAIGLTFGVLAGVPAAAVVLLARRRDDEDDEWQPTTIDYAGAPAYKAPTFQDSSVIPYRSLPAPVCHEDVTPYYRGARRLLGMEPLPKRADAEPTALTPDQIREVENYLAHQKSLGQLGVRWE